MKKNLSILIMLLLAVSLFGCGSAAVQSGLDSSEPIVIELSQPSEDSSVQLTAEPVASPIPEAEQWPVPVEGGDDPIGDGSGNYASEIRLIPYGDQLYYIGQFGNRDAVNGRAPQNLWQINRDGSDRRMIVDEDTIMSYVAEQSGYDDNSPNNVYKIEGDRIYFSIFYLNTSDNIEYQMYSVNMQGGDMRLEMENAEAYSTIDYNTTVAGDYIYTYDINQIVRKSATGDAETIYQNSAYDIRSIAVQGEWIYLIDQKNTDNSSGNIRCVNIQTHAAQTIMELPLDQVYFFTSINPHGNWIYYLNNERVLCRVPINGGSVETILTGPVYDFVIFDHTIFYFLTDIEGSGAEVSLYFSTLLRRVDLDGKNDAAIDVIN